MHKGLQEQGFIGKSQAKLFFQFGDIDWENFFSVVFHFMAKNLKN